MTSPQPIDPLLLEILACPETKQRLRLADSALVQKLNRAREEGRLKCRDGEAHTEIVEAGLIREDGVYVYPIVDGIPKLCIEHGIVVADYVRRADSSDSRPS